MSVYILDYSLNHLHNYNKIILESELERLTGNESAYLLCDSYKVLLRLCSDVLIALL